MTGKWRHLSTRGRAGGPARLAVATGLLLALLAACDGSGATATGPTGSAAPTATVPPSPAPSASPAPTEPAPPSRCLDEYPAQLPDTVFLSWPAGGDKPGALCYRYRAPLPGEEDWWEMDHLPQVCAKPSHASDRLIADRRGVHRTFDEDPDPDQLATTSYDHTVTRYTGDGARAYLAELRQAVQRCGSYERRRIRYDYSIVAGPKLGDESLRMRLHLRLLDPPQEGNEPVDQRFYISVVRRGAHVSVVFDHGWEGIPSRDAAIFSVMAQAAKLLPAA